MNGRHYFSNMTSQTRGITPYVFSNVIKYTNIFHLYMAVIMKSVHLPKWLCKSNTKQYSAKQSFILISNLLLTVDNILICPNLALVTSHFSHS